MGIPGKVIITAAITGGVHVPSQSPYLPITPDQIVDECVRAWEAGAAVAHIHVRDPENGRPIPSMALFRDVAERVKRRCDIVLCTTTGGAPGMSHEERVGVVRELAPELASCNMGSMNFSLAPLADRIKDYQHDWEKPFLERTEDNIFANTFTSMRYFLETMNEQGSRPELEVYDAGMVNNAAFMIQAGALKRPVYIQFGGGAIPVPDWRCGAGNGGQCARRSGGQCLPQQGATGEEQRRTGGEDGPYHPRIESRTRHPGRSPPHPAPQGSQRSGVLRDN